MVVVPPPFINSSYDSFSSRNGNLHMAGQRTFGVDYRITLCYDISNPTKKTKLSIDTFDHIPFQFPAALYR